VIDPKECVDLVDENTIGICAIIGTTYTGEYEDVKAINDLLIERKIDCPIHGKGEFLETNIAANSCSS
jgi:glutamate decarboxylase